MVELADTPGLEPGAARHRGSSPFFRRISVFRRNSIWRVFWRRNSGVRWTSLPSANAPLVRLVLLFLGLFLGALSIAGCARSGAGRIYFELEALDQRQAQTLSLPNAETDQIAIELPEGARFPIVTSLQGARWTLADTEPSDSLAEVSAIRVSPDSARIAAIINRPNLPSELREMTLASGAPTFAPVRDVYDAVYLGDGSLIATLLENQQPRGVFRMTASGPIQITRARGNETVLLSVSNPEVVRFRSGANVREVVIGDAVGTPRTPQHPSDRSFGCTRLTRSEQDLSCEPLYAPSPDGIEVPISLVSSRSARERDAILLRSYGAYGQRVGDALSTSERFLIKRGMRVAFAHIRGGGELGPAWHLGGMGANRSNSVADLKAAIDRLRSLYPNARIALSSDSAGAIAVIAAAKLRASTLAAVVLHAPLLNIEATLAAFPEDRAEFGDTPAELSPVSDIDAKGEIPPILLVCAVHDPLVRYQDCLALKDHRPGRVTVMREDSELHNRAWSRAQALEQEAQVLNWLLPYFEN